MNYSLKYNNHSDLSRKEISLVEKDLNLSFHSLREEMKPCLSEFSILYFAMYLMVILNCHSSIYF